MVWDAVLIFIAVITAVVVWLRWNYNHWKKKGIPYVEPTILFGNMKDALVGNLNLCIISERIYNAFPGAPVVGFYRMRTPVLQIRDLGLIKAVLVSDFNSFRNNGMNISREADPIFGRNPFFLKDEEWKETRRIQTHNHTASKLKVLYGYVEEVKDELISYLNDNIGKKFDTQDLCARLTVDVVSSVVYGIKTRSQVEDSEFKKRSESLLDMSWRFMLFRIVPKLFEKFKIPIMTKLNHDYFYNLVESVVKMRKEQNLSRADFIQNLIDDKTENLSIIDMTAQTMTFFIDGYATSATEMSFLLYMIALHPDVQHRVRDELNTVKKLDFDTLHHLPYLDAVLNETLRLYPAGIALARECNDDVTINVGNKSFEFKKGDILEIPVYALHRDPEYFPDPLKFDPERFMNETNHPALLTFGAGPRACFGSRFAKTQLKAAIAGLVKNFRIIPWTNDLALPTITNNKALLIGPDKEMCVKFEKL